MSYRANAVALAILLGGCSKAGPAAAHTSPPGAAPASVALREESAEIRPWQRPAHRAADGEWCTRAEDCASGICEGSGCGRLQGRCASATRRCGLDTVVYCSCAQQTFTGSRSCPGDRYLHEGRCQVQGSPDISD